MGQRQYRFRCIEVSGFDARPRAFHRGRGHLCLGAGDRSSAGGRKRGLTTKSRPGARFREKRLIGFEPTTFCMAIRPTLWRLQCQNWLICRRFPYGPTSTRRRQCARICTDMQRFGHFWQEVPESRRPVPVRHAYRPPGTDPTLGQPSSPQQAGFSLRPCPAAPISSVFESSA